MSTTGGNGDAKDKHTKGKSGGGRQYHNSNAGGGNPRTVSSAAAVEFPMLKLASGGGSSNIHEWERKAYLSIAKQYGVTAQFFILRDGEGLPKHYKYPDLEMPIPQNLDPFFIGPFHQNDLDPFHISNDPHGLVRTEFMERRKILLNKQATAEGQYGQIFSILISKMSLESVTACKLASMVEWEQAIVNNDLIYLLTVIRQTHIVDTAVQDDPFAASQLRNKYSNCKQFPGENVAKYYERLEDILKDFDSVSMERPSDLDIAMDFLNGLDKGRFSTLLVDVQNDMLRKRQNPNFNGFIPENVSDALLLANKYRVAVAGGRSQHAATFITGVTGNNGKSSKNGRNDKSGNGNQKKNQSSAAAPKGGNSSMDEVECFKCHKKGHMQRNCPNTEKSNSYDASNGCVICGSKSHVTSKCPYIEQARASVADAKNNGENSGSNATLMLEDFRASGNFMMAHKQCHLTDNHVLLDNEAELHVFCNSSLVKDICHSKSCENFFGVGGTLTTCQKGTFLDLPVSYSAKAPANILSLSQLRDSNFMLGYNYEDDYFWLDFSNGRQLLFTRCKGLYACDLSNKHSYVMKKVSDGSMLSNPASYTNRQVEMAKVAKDFQQKLGFRAPAAVIKAINHGAIKNVPITAHDVVRAENLFGPSVPLIKGRSNQQPNSKLGTYQTIPRSLSTVINLHTDIMFLYKDGFLIGVTKPIDLTLVAMLGMGKLVKTASNLKGALGSIIGNIRAHGFSISTVLSDEEGGLLCLANQIPSIKFITSGAGGHDPVAESKIGQVKRTAACIKASLPYRLSRVMLRWLVRHAVFVTNLVPGAGGMPGLSPREAFTGRKPDANTDLKIAFGSYAQVSYPEKQRNLEERSFGAICLGAVGNEQGSYKFLNLATGGIVTANHFRPLPF